MLICIFVLRNNQNYAFVPKNCLGQFNLSNNHLFIPQNDKIPNSSIGGMIIGKGP